MKELHWSDPFRKITRKAPSYPCLSMSFPISSFVKAALQILSPWWPWWPWWPGYMSQTWDIFVQKLTDFRSPNFTTFKDQVDKSCGYWAGSYWVVWPKHAETDCVDCLRRKSCVTWSVFLWRCMGWQWDGWFSMLGWTMWTWSLKILLRNGAKQDTARGLTHAEKDQNWSDMDHPMWFLEVVAGFKHKRVNIHWTTVFEGNIYETLTAVYKLFKDSTIWGG